MRIQQSICLMVFCLFVVSAALTGCKTSAEEKSPKLVISNVDYTIRQTHSAHGNSYVIDAHGKIQNVGDADAKKVVVTAYCRSCTLAFTSQRWFTSDVAKTENQKDTISYLPAGGEEEFSFEEVAFFFTYDETPPTDLPEKMEVVVESYEPVE